MNQAEQRQFLTEHAYPADAIAPLCAAWETLGADNAARSVFAAWHARYDDAPTLDYAAANADIAQAAEACGANSYTGLLLFYIGLVPRLWQRYEQTGYTREMLDGVALDLRCKAVECHTVYGVWGTFVAPWYEGFFTLQRFALGRLQFEESPLKAACVVNGAPYAEGTPVINVHIPSSGSLAPALCDAAFAAARAFFAPPLPLFTCESWLLYPPNDIILQGQKNILAFAHRFTIIKTVHTTPETDMWRIFGVMPQPPYADLADWPQESSLQRAYKQWLLDGNATGEGIGVFAR